MHRVVESQGEEHADELEAYGHLEGVRVEPVESTLVLGQEHVEVRIEDGFGDQLEVLILDATLISPLLSNELYLHGTPQILFDLAEFGHGIVENVGPVDIEVEEDESLDRKLMVEIHILAVAILHALADTLPLLVDRLQLQNPVLIVKVQQKRVVHKVEGRDPSHHQLVLLNRVDLMHNGLAVEVLEGQSWIGFVTFVELTQKTAE